MNLRICTKSSDGQHNFQVTGQPCYNGCGVDQYQLRYGHKKQEDSQTIHFSSVMDRILSKKPTETKARNYMEEIAWKYLIKFNWKNETCFEYIDDKGKERTGDWTLFWMACNRYVKRNVIADFERILQWGARVGAHPRAVVSVLNKKPAPLPVYAKQQAMAFNKKC